MTLSVSSTPNNLSPASAALRISVSDSIYGSWSDAQRRAWERRFLSPERYFYKYSVPGSVREKGPISLREHLTFLAALRRLPPPCDWGTFSLLVPGRIGVECRTYFQMLRAAGLVSSSGIVKPLPKYLGSKTSLFSRTRISVYLRRSLKKFVPKHIRISVNDSLIRPMKRRGRRIGEPMSLGSFSGISKFVKEVHQVRRSKEIKGLIEMTDTMINKVQRVNRDTGSQCGSENTSCTLNESDSFSTSIEDGEKMFRNRSDETSNSMTKDKRRNYQADSTEVMFGSKRHQPCTDFDDDGEKLSEGSECTRIDIMFSDSPHRMAIPTICSSPQHSSYSSYMKEERFSLQVSEESAALTNPMRGSIQKDEEFTVPRKGKVHWIGTLLQLFLDGVTYETGFRRKHWLERRALVQRFEDFIDELHIAHQDGEISTVEDIDECYSDRLNRFVQEVEEMQKRQECHQTVILRLGDVLVM